MLYDILEAKIELKDTKLLKVTVLVNCTSPNSKPYSDVRAIYADTRVKSGYFFLTARDSLCNDLLQKVAAGGCETQDRDLIFPNWKSKLNNG